MFSVLSPDGFPAARVPHRISWDHNFLEGLRVWCVFFAYVFSGPRAIVGVAIGFVLLLGMLDLNRQIVHTSIIRHGNFFSVMLDSDGFQRCGHEIVWEGHLKAEILL